LNLRLGQEQAGNSKVLGQGYSCLLGNQTHECCWHCAEDTAAVAGLAVGGNRTAVHHAREGMDGVFEE
jgi:hypothetical protein